MKRVELRRPDVTLSALVGGDSGGTVLLLPGLAGSGQEFEPTATALLPDHRVIALDQRGHGHSTRRPADLSRAAYVADVIEVIAALGDGGPVDLVGQSMGAHTAMLAAARHPASVRRLVLLEGGVGGAGAGGYPAELGRWLASWPVPFPDRETAVRFLDSTPTALAWARDLEQRSDGLWPRFDPDVMESAIEAVADEACWADWAQVSAPTLLVLGERSAIDPEEVRRMRVERPQVEHVVVPRAGHDVHLDQPAVWTAVLREFLNR